MNNTTKPLILDTKAATIIMSGGIRVKISLNRVYAQPFYVLRKTKFYAAVKKGVCAPSYVIPKLYLHL